MPLWSVYVLKKYAQNFDNDYEARSKLSSLSPF